MYNKMKTKNSQEKGNLYIKRFKVAWEIRRVRTNKSLFILKNCKNGRKRQRCNVK